jgi:hypothetical protein
MTPEQEERVRRYYEEAQRRTYKKYVRERPEQQYHIFNPHPDSVLGRLFKENSVPKSEYGQSEQERRFNDWLNTYAEPKSASPINAKEGWQATQLGGEVDPRAEPCPPSKPESRPRPEAEVSQPNPGAWNDLAESLKKEKRRLQQKATEDETTDHSLSGLFRSFFGYLYSKP